MATYSVNRSALDKVLSGTTADIVNLDAAAAVSRWIILPPPDA